MDHYNIRFYKKAENDLENIYSYIAIEKESIINAKKITDKIYRKIKSLECFPYSHQDRLDGKYANQGYKQLIVDKYIVIYRIDKVKKIVYIVTIQHQRRNR